ncbi:MULTISPECIES: hypothetical protein [Thiomicrorhabdus]|uniref:Retention module-containing protein n=1 Tax=Thiomicrorhabdus heinhorstiae TaxID=2748010 RepID=A0ABS0BXF4_9GAMM|nr:MULTISPECIES: hypothetical protein [Thiomicrorhabdus]MBF6057689.1 hypothetical protein [Thiomicrorhabdus heinhorstiae]
MSTAVGEVTSLEGVVQAINPTTGEVRVLGVGSQVFSGEMLQTLDGKVTVSMANGDELNLGGNTKMRLDGDVTSVAKLMDPTDAAAGTESMSEALGTTDINELDATAAGDAGVAGSSAAGYGYVIDRTGAEGNVTSGFGLSENGGIGGQFIVARNSLGGDTGTIGSVTPPTTTPTDGDRTLLGPYGYADELIDNVTTLVDDLLGTNLGALDDPTDQLTTDLEDLLTGKEDLIGTVDNLLGDNGSVDQVVGGLTDTVDDLLGTNTGALDAPVDDLTTAIDDLLNGNADLGETVTTLLGPVGSVDQVVDGVTTVVDDLLGTNLGALDNPEDELTTDIQDLLTGQADLGETVTSLLGPVGSVDQVVDGVTTVADDLLGTDLGAVDQPVDELTTDVQDLLTGQAGLGETLTSLLGPVGSADQVVDGVTTAVDDLLGTNVGAIDTPVDHLTTDVEELLTGQDDLGTTVVDLLGDNGSVDQVVDGLTDTLGDLLGGADLTPLDDVVDQVTTAVSDLLGGSAGGLGSLLGGIPIVGGLLGEIPVVGDLLAGGGSTTLDPVPSEGDSGSGLTDTADELVDDVTDGVDYLAAGLGIDSTPLTQMVDDTVEQLTQGVDDLVTGPNGAGGGLTDTVDTLVDQLVGGLGDALGLQQITDPLTVLVDSTTDAVDALLINSGPGLEGELDTFVTSATDAVDLFANDALGIDTAPLTDVVDQLVDEVTNGLDQVTQVGQLTDTVDEVVFEVTDALDGILGANDITQAVDLLADQATDAVDNAVDGVDSAANPPPSSGGEGLLSGLDILNLNLLGDNGNNNP